MKLNDKVTSLDLSKKLKEIGIHQETLFYWHNIYTPYSSIVYQDFKTEISGDFLISAYIASELLDILPSRIIVKRREPFDCYRLHIKKSTIFFNDEPKDTFSLNYNCDTTTMEDGDCWIKRVLFRPRIYAVNFCDTLAITLIELYDKGYLEIQIMCQ
jgi:hypothetical protein